ncbi:YajG family lipoprotein [Aliidiomarina sp. Khilg15.8]
MIKRIITGALVALMLSACQSPPDPVTLNPQLETTASDQRIALQVRDQRAQNHVLRIERSDDPAEFATADPTLASLISQRLGQRWTLDDEASARMQVSIRDALIIIRQGTLRHDTEQQVRLHVLLTTPQGEVEKTFNGRRESNGPLRADRDRIQNEFAGLLAEVLSELANDDTLNRYIEGQ